MVAGNRNKSGPFVALLAAAAIAAFSVMTFSCSRSETPQPEKSEVSSRSGPLLEQDLTKVVPVEELDVDAKDPQALSMLADRYFDSRNYGQAAELYEKAIELNPRDIDSYNDLGLAYHYTNKSSLALDILKKGIAVDPSYQRIWLSYGFVLLSTGKTAEAKTALDKVMELNPENDIGKEAQRMLGKLQ
jgi:tetratricopeptide (TPR) repeat protein